MPIDENIKRNISISPKINGINFFNMIRYALLLLNLKPENLELSIGNNYYDILVRFLLDELERILQRGLYTGYRDYNESLAYIFACKNSSEFEDKCSDFINTILNVLSTLAQTI
jgi:5-methylcytosine-specific restriction endonuclease McrBC regulatory subunit McrC